MRLIGALGYAIGRGGAKLLAATLWRLDVKGVENIPSTGAFLFCPVHRSNIDGPLASALTKRRMRFLTKVSMFKIGWLGKIFLAMGAIPVNRGVPDRQSLNACIKELEAGYPLVLFPEGGRRDGPVIGDIQEGAAYLALRAGVPIVPVGIGGSEKANPRGTIRLRAVKVRVVIGEPLTLAKPAGDRVPRSAIREGTELLRSRMQSLFDEAEGRIPA